MELKQQFPFLLETRGEMTFPDCSSSPPGSRWWGEEHMSGQLPSRHHYPAASQRCAHIWSRVLLWPWVKLLVYRDSKIKLVLILQWSKSDEASPSLHALGRSRRTAWLSIKKLGMETSVLMGRRTWQIYTLILVFTVHSYLVSKQVTWQERLLT